MKEIKYLGRKRLKNDTNNYDYSLFECSKCHKHIIKKTNEGLPAQFCSHKCYAKARKKRWAYNESVIISGYRYILSHDHPKKNKRGYVAEHRLVAEKAIKRLLKKNEVVHHLNGDKLDNIPENLLVLPSSHHILLHKILAKRDKYGKFTKT